jgi:hypothetical protein
MSAVNPQRLALSAPAIFGPHCDCSPASEPPAHLLTADRSSSTLSRCAQQPSWSATNRVPATARSTPTIATLIGTLPSSSKIMAERLLNLRRLPRRHSPFTDWRSSAISFDSHRLPSLSVTSRRRAAGRLGPRSSRATGARRRLSSQRSSRISASLDQRDAVLRNVQTLSQLARTLRKVVVPCYRYSTMSAHVAERKNTSHIIYPT